MRLRSLWMVVAVVGLMGCGGGKGFGPYGGDDDDSDNGPSAEEAAEQLAAADCDKYNSCSPYFITMIFGDVNTCKQRLAMDFKSAAKAPNTGASAQNVLACAKAIPNAPCPELLINKVPNECVWKGSLPNGTACGADAQCQSGTCKLAAGSSCGTCGFRAQAGSGCSVDADCDMGLVCFKNVCVAPSPAGGSCDQNRPCMPNSVCNGSICVFVNGPGGQCNPQADNCDGYSGHFCNPNTSMCQIVSTAEAGRECGWTGGGYSECKAMGACIGPQGASQGTCQGYSADGAECSDQSFKYCMPPARCSSGRCTLVNPAACL